jgi:hypothetical protein
MDTITLRISGKDCYSIKFGIKYSELWHDEIVLCKTKHKPNKYKFVNTVIKVVIYFHEDNYCIMNLKIGASSVMSSYTDFDHHREFDILLSYINDRCYYWSDKVEEDTLVEYPIYQLLNGFKRTNDFGIEWRNYLIYFDSDRFVIKYENDILFEANNVDKNWTIRLLIQRMRDNNAPQELYHLQSIKRIKSARVIHQ